MVGRGSDGIGWKVRWGEVGDEGPGRGGGEEGRGDAAQTTTDRCRSWSAGGGGGS